MTAIASLSPIMVVEDSDEDFDTLLQALGKTGMHRKVFRAISGEDCLAQLRGKGTDIGVQPVFILLDLNIPGIDGRETLREVKADPILRLIPVVIFTTSSNPRDLKSCYELGANAYHIKPIQYPDHISLLEDIFRYWIGRVSGSKNTHLSYLGGYQP
jgi:two-component system, response regulator